MISPIQIFPAFSLELDGLSVSLADDVTTVTGEGTDGTTIEASENLTLSVPSGFIGIESPEVRVPASLTSFAIGQAQRASTGAGANWTIRAQRGNGGAGGKLTLGGGEPGTATTHAPGGVDIDLGVSVDFDNSGYLQLLTSGSAIKASYYSHQLGSFVERWITNYTYWVLAGLVRIGDDSLNAVAGMSTNGFAVGTDPQANQNRTFLIADRAPSGAPSSGTFTYSEGGQLKGWNPNGVKQELGCVDASSGATSKRIYDRLGRLTSTTTSTKTICTIAAADLPSGNYSGTFLIQWGAFDTTNSTTAGGHLSVLVDRIGGATTIRTAAANQQIGATNGTTSVDTTTTLPQLAANAPSSDDLTIQITTLSTANVRIWARVVDSTVIEH